MGELVIRQEGIFYRESSKVVPSIEEVIYNDPAAIVKWSDGTKTVVKAIDEFDEYNGLCIAIAKKVLGSNTAIKKEVAKAIRQK